MYVIVRLLHAPVFSACVVLSVCGSLGMRLHFMCLECCVGAGVIQRA